MHSIIGVIFLFCSHYFAIKKTKQADYKSKLVARIGSSLLTLYNMNELCKNVRPFDKSREEKLIWISTVRTYFIFKLTF